MRDTGVVRLLTVALLVLVVGCETSPPIVARPRTAAESPPVAFRPANAPAEVVVSITADVPDEPPTRGSVVIVAVPLAQQPAGATPGPFSIYGRPVWAIHGVEAPEVREVAVEVDGQTHDVALCAWYDRDGVFLQAFGVAPGSAWSSSCPTWHLSMPPPDVVVDTLVAPRQRVVPAGYRDHTLNTSGGEVRFLVGLPPSYDKARKKRYPTLYAMHGFNGDRFTYLERFAHWRRAMEATGQEMIVVVLEARGRFGHHLYVDSEANGPMGQVLAKDIVSFVDRHYRTRAERDARGIWGQSSGGFTAVAAMLDHPTVFGHSFPCSPDPLDLSRWWFPGGGDNAYGEDGTGDYNVFFHSGGKSLSMRQFVEVETNTGLYGQFTAFLAVFSDHQPGETPLPFALPFDPNTGEVHREVWTTWLDREPTRRITELSRAERDDLDGRFHITVSDSDPFRLTPTTRSFARTLAEAGIDHELDILEGAGHGDYYNERFMRRLWERVFVTLSGGDGHEGFWSKQRGGANYFNAVPQRERFAAGSKLGLQFIRLVPDKWKSQQRDFLIGSAYKYRGLVTEDVLELRRVLDEAHRAGLKVVLSMLSLPGARWEQHKNPIDKDEDLLWKDEAYQRQAGRFWRDLARELRDHPAIVAWNPLNEPHPERADKVYDGTGDEYADWYAANKGKPADINVFNQRIVAAIREVDPDTPIILDGPIYAAPSGFRFLEPVADERTLYSFHLYEPWDYVNKKANAGRYGYPDKMPAGDATRRWSSADLDALTKPVEDWAVRHKIPAHRIVAGEFGCNRQVTGCDRFVRDIASHLHAKGWHWAFYSFREDTWDKMDYELGTEKLGAAYWDAVERGDYPKRKWRNTPTIRHLRRLLKRQ